MKTDRSYWDQIDDYLHGRLSPEEEQSMEQAIQTDADLKEEVQQQEKIVKGLRQLRLEALTEQTLAWEAEIGEEKEAATTPTSAPDKSAKTLRLRPWMWAAAAGVAALIVVTILLNRQGNSQGQRLAIQAFSMPEIQGPRGEGTPYYRGLGAFQNSSYPAATEQLALVSSSDTTNYPAAQFLLGLCQFELGNYAAALTYFQTAKQQENDILVLIGAHPDNVFVSAQHIEWYLALSYLASGQQQAGQQMIEEILRDTSHPYFSAAKALLK